MVYPKQKCIDYIEKMTILVIFLYILYILVWIQHSCLANTVFASDPSSSVIKRLWCAIILKRLIFLWLDFEVFTSIAFVFYYILENDILSYMICLHEDIKTQSINLSEFITIIYYFRFCS